jgi:multicomponent Na+:H+ antiporter subunit D
MCVILKRPLLVRTYATVVTLVTLTISFYLAGYVIDHGAIAYHIGGWKPPWGIEFRVDALTALLLVVVTVIASVVVLTGLGERSHCVPDKQRAFFHAAFLLCLTGLLGMTLTADAFNAFVFLEIASLSTYTMVALGKSRRALSAAISYLMLGTVGGTFFLLGVGILYSLTGSLNMADLAVRLEEVANDRALLVAAVFLFLGIGLKVAIFPLHQWLPNAYSFAPSSVSAFLAGTATKVSFYLLIRFIYSVLGAALVFELFGLRNLLLPLSLVSMFVGAAAAIFQTDLKRLLAYSSVSQLGYMTLGVSLGSKAGLTAGLLHVFNHATMKAGLFLAVAAIVAKLGSAKIAALAGLGKKMPLTAAAIVVGGFALIGVPGTGGFISKWMLVQATLEDGSPWLALMVLLSSLLAVAYVWKVVEVLYFRPPSEDIQAGEQPGIALPCWVLSAATVVFGFFPQAPLQLCELAATQLTQGADVVLTVTREPAADVEHHPGGDHQGGHP